MKKISVLQSWRALFIIMICIEHMALTNKLSFWAAGGEGVTFFIVLSGFLMSYVYLDRMHDYSIKAQKDFLIKKIKKFYPLHIMALLAALLLNVLVVLKNEGIAIASLTDLAVKTVLNALFLQVYVPIDGIFMNNVNGVAWFLSAIVFCYANSVFAIGFVKRIDKKGKLLLGFAGCLILHTVLVEIFRKNDYRTFVLYVFPFFRFLEYFIGMLIGKWFVSYKMEIGKKTGTLLEILAIVIFFVNHTLVQNGFWADKGIKYNYFVLGTAMVIVTIFAFEAGYVSSLLKNRVLVYIGNISFDIYIMHQVIIKYVTTALGWNDLAAIVSAIFIIIFAVLSNKYFDIVKKKISFLLKKSIAGTH